MIIRNRVYMAKTKIFIFNSINLSVDPKNSIFGTTCDFFLEKLNLPHFRLIGSARVSDQKCKKFIFGNLTLTFMHICINLI